MNDYVNELFPLRNLSETDFERFALNIIGFEVRARQKDLLKGNEAYKLIDKEFDLKSGVKLMPDAVAPSGVDDSSFTVIEVKKTNRLISEAVEQINQIISRYLVSIPMRKHWSSEYSAQTKLLIIFSGSKILKQRLLEEHRNDTCFEIWSIDDLTEKARLYPFEYNAFLELIISRSSGQGTIDAVARESKHLSNEDLDAQNNRLIAELRNSFGKNHISLVLGTGVSMDYNNNLSWNALSKRLYDCLDSRRKFTNKTDAISILGGDNVSSVQYSKTNLGNRYPTSLYKLIYPRKKAYSIGNTSLDECANLISQQESGRITITKVLTYNYDDYLEQALKARLWPCRVLYRPFDYLDETTPIYHVHGYMPEGCNYTERQEYIKSVILSEEDYFKCYGDSSNWNVAIQLETFKDEICIFIGNSITDFNEKRLLNKTRQEIGKSNFADV